ncbi:protein MAINTENANCE OF MERISTEMS-like [Silene latifolia]|uniref:protein MAINTENANCE OF MERISTEMS-like n=1 Tax=Silene latifolia TaxID=37657 RepID=UPI003D778580
MRSWIKLYERPKAVREIREIWLSEAVAARVEASGLGILRECFTIGLDDNLLSAFIERWHPDTNTFHMPFGEISIMLHDVQHILGIPVSGERVHVDGLAEADDSGLRGKIARFYGVYLSDVVPSRYKNGGLLTSDLRNVVYLGNEHDSLRAYLLILLGHTLFMDKSVRIASRRDSTGVSGCLPLLQAWIYEYFPRFQPGGGFFFEDRPLVEAWASLPRAKGDSHTFQMYRHSLDDLRSEHVRWLPYGNRPQGACRVSLYSGFIRHLDIVEPYQPDRCMRQFGYIQAIPLPMPIPIVESRAANGNYRLDFGQEPDKTWGSENSITPLRKLSRKAYMLFEYGDGYMTWYAEISHPYLYPPSHRLHFRSVEFHEEPEVALALSRKFKNVFQQTSEEA